MEQEKNKSIEEINLDGLAIVAESNRKEAENKKREELQSKAKKNYLESGKGHKASRKRKEQRNNLKHKIKKATVVLGGVIIIVASMKAGYEIKEYFAEKEQIAKEAAEEKEWKEEYDNALSTYEPFAEEIINENLSVLYTQIKGINVPGENRTTRENPVYDWNAKGAAEKVKAYQKDAQNQGYEDPSRNIIITVYAKLKEDYPQVGPYECTERMVKEITGGLSLEEYYESLGYPGEDINKVEDEIRQGLMANHNYEINITQEGGLGR